MPGALDQAVAAAPAEPTLRYHLAAGLAAIGDSEAALRELDIALRSREFADRELAERLRQTLAVAK